MFQLSQVRKFEATLKGFHLLKKPGMTSALLNRLLLDKLIVEIVCQYIDFLLAAF